jgi:hypothetical protein
MVDGEAYSGHDDLPQTEAIRNVIVWRPAAEYE